MIRPVRFRTMAAALALGVMPLAALAPATPALAQAEASNDAAYEELFAAMEAAIDQKLVLDASLAALAREFAGTAEFSQAEAASPGLIAEVVGNIRPIIEGQSARVSKLYHPTTLALFARHLSPAEARDVAAFYRSDLERKMMGNFSRQFTPEATLSGIETAAPVTREQVQADLGKAASATVSAMSQDDLMELGRQAQANPALLKLSLIGPGVQEIRVQMENEPLTAEEDAAIVAVVEDVFGRRFPAQ